MRILVSLIALMVITSCGPKPMYEKTVVIDDPWDYGNTLEFEIDVIDTEIFYDMILEISHDIDFGFQNIYVKIDTDFPIKEDTQDIVSLDISDGKGGFLGNCSGGSCKVEILLQKAFRFENKGKHKVSISQYGREDDLVGINEVTLSILSAVKN